ncbi:SUMO protease ULP1 [Sugiyamaella lignohabitans]|uniref:SUMO protease ULP1 n=1 Tax=Sugiyamaella lignohabitans TaxID=796027 RepID=A0A167E3G0_9ASCO|nr:SUMO protease ULP1 [Sugiyamaella lignohabitans]ANB13591.1 SUMO protease ULP1 [Sugiyamaella lignohabitans]
MTDYASKLSKSSVLSSIGVDSPQPLPGANKRRYIEAFTGAYSGASGLVASRVQAPTNLSQQYRPQDQLIETGQRGQAHQNGVLTGLGKEPATTAAASGLTFSSITESSSGVSSKPGPVYKPSADLVSGGDSDKVPKQTSRGSSQVHRNRPQNRSLARSSGSRLTSSTSAEKESAPASLDWVRHLSISAATGASSGIQQVVVGLFSLARQLLNTEFTTQEDLIGPETESESESAKKRRKIEMSTADIVDLTLDDDDVDTTMDDYEDCTESINSPDVSFRQAVMPGALPFHEADFLDKPAYERSPRLNNKNRHRDGAIAQIMSTEIVSGIPRNKSPIPEPSRRDPLTSSSLLRSTLAKAASTVAASNAARSSDFGSLDLKTLPSNSMNFPITTKSSGGLFTPTAPREPPISQNTTNNFLTISSPSVAAAAAAAAAAAPLNKSIPSRAQAPSTSSLIASYTNSPVNSAKRLYQNIQQPLFQNTDQGQLVTASAPVFPPSPVIQNVTYGTKFFLRLHNSQQNSQEMKSLPTTKTDTANVPMIPRRLKNDEESYEQFAKRLRDAFKGMYYQGQGPTSSPKRSSPSKSPADQKAPMAAQSYTPLGKVSYKDPRYLVKLHRKRELLEKEKATSTSSSVPYSTTTTAPESPQLSKEKFKKYQEVHNATENIRKQIADLKVNEGDEFRKPLDPAQLSQVEDYWYNHVKYPAGNIIGTAFRVDLQVQDVRSLADASWLNDNVIDFYLAMATEKANKNSDLTSFAFSTHFFSKLEGPQGYKAVSRWAKRKNIDVTKLDFVFVPINLSNVHWCLAVINNREKKFEFYDSMGGDGSRSLSKLCDYMVNEADRITPGQHEAHVEKYSSYERVSRASCPQQTNGYDCGVFTCKNVELLSAGRKLTYRQADMKNIRRNMAHQVLHRALSSKL